MTTTPNGSYAQAWFFDEYNETTRAMLQHWMNSNKKHHDVAASKSRKCETMSNLDWRGFVPHVSPCIVTPRALVHRGCDVFFHMRSVWISYKHPATPTNTISLIIQNLQLIHYLIIIVFRAISTFSPSQFDVLYCTKYAPAMHVGAFVLTPLDCLRE